MSLYAEVLFASGIMEDGPGAIPVQCVTPTLPHYLLFIEKVFRTSSFHHNPIRQWSSQSVKQAPWDNALVGWFPEQTSQIVL